MERFHLRMTQTLWNPWFYIGKTIDGIEEHSDGSVTIKWQVDADASLRGEVTGTGRPLDWFKGRPITSCVTRRTRFVSEGDLQPSRRVTIMELLDNPDVYHGKRVIVSGYYRGQFESRSLSVTREASEQREYANSVWVGGRSSFAEPHRQGGSD